MKISNSSVFQAMEDFAPLDFAFAWDNVGLQIGSYHKSVKKVMITLDVLESIVDEAIENDVDLIIAHHPMLFTPLKQINNDTPKGRVIQKLIKHDITVYASHTNLDIAVGGVNDLLADVLELDSRENLIDLHTENLCKIAVYVPRSHIQEVRNALSEAGAGHVGNYSHCTFQSEGQGTFMPLEGTTPFIGKKDKLEHVDEIKIETIVREKDLSIVIEAMVKAHPYEEVAYDTFSLLNKGNTYGLGRVGVLKKTMGLERLSKYIKEVFDLSHVRVIGDLSKNVKKVAILGGSGEKYINEAKQVGADVYITGDITFHTAQDALEMGLSIIDAGHYIEKIMKRATKEYLEKKLDSTEIEIIVSKTNTDPFQFV